MRKVEWAMLQALHNQRVSVEVTWERSRGSRLYSGTVCAFEDVVAIEDRLAEGLITKVIVEESLNADVKATRDSVTITLPGTRQARDG